MRRKAKNPGEHKKECLMSTVLLVVLIMAMVFVFFCVCSTVKSALAGNMGAGRMYLKSLIMIRGGKHNTGKDEKDFKMFLISLLTATKLISHLKVQTL